ncbi:hypothetical protein [Streptomyces pseudogriseolus]|uniref:hypothetical protein n=1 Tax=Streptomyces pseudogriseolus TaxID=36817 RepID=UPI003FA311C5
MKEATYRDAEAATTDQLRRMTPPEIDALFYATYKERFHREETQERAWQRLYGAAGVKAEYRTGRPVWPMNHHDLEQRAREGLRRGDTDTNPVGQDVKRHGGSLTGWYTALVDAYRALVASRAALAALEVVELTLNAEFWRRGGWTRAYLVQTHNGHVHNTMNCPTCNKGEERTRFAWMIEYSGKSEEEIVEAAASRACTVCYPSAPVDVLQRPTTMFGPDELERAKAAEERAARKAEKEAKAKAAAITLPDGTPLRDEVDRNGRQTRAGNVVRTLRTAKMELNQEAWYAVAWGDSDGRHGRNMLHLARAIAWKEAGLPVRPEIDEKAVEVMYAETILADAVQELLQQALAKAEKSVAAARRREARQGR